MNEIIVAIEVLQLVMHFRSLLLNTIDHDEIRPLNKIDFFQTISPLTLKIPIDLFFIINPGISNAIRLSLEILRNKVRTMFAVVLIDCDSTAGNQAIFCTITSIFTLQFSRPYNASITIQNSSRVFNELWYWSLEIRTPTGKYSHYSKKLFFNLFRHFAVGGLFSIQRKRKVITYRQRFETRQHFTDLVVGRILNLVHRTIFQLERSGSHLIIDNGKSG